MTNPSEFNPADIFYQLEDLSHLMQTIHDVLHEMDYGTPTDGRNHDLERVAALHRIASLQVDGLHQAASVFDNSTWIRAGKGRAGA